MCSLIYMCSLIQYMIGLLYDLRYLRNTYIYIYIYIYVLLYMCSLVYMCSLIQYMIGLLYVFLTCIYVSIGQQQQAVELGTL